MIKDVMVPLQVDAADEPRLAAAAAIAARFEGQIIGLFFNLLPLLALPVEVDQPQDLVIGLLRRAKEAGDEKVAALAVRMGQLGVPFEIRRFDAFPEDVTEIAVREARASDTFVVLRPDADMEDPDRFVESVLLGNGRHLYLLPSGYDPARLPGKHMLIAWNGSREAARAVAEAMPFLHIAQKITVLVIVRESPPVEREAVLGVDLKHYLGHHGMKAELRHVKASNTGTSATLMSEALKCNADTIVLGGYGHSRTRERLLGGTTYELLQKAPIPVIMAH